MLKATGSAELLTFINSDFAFCDQIRKSNVEHAFSFVTRWYIEIRKKIMSQEAQENLSSLICLTKLQKLNSCKMLHI